MSGAPGPQREPEPGRANTRAVGGAAQNGPFAQAPPLVSPLLRRPGAVPADGIDAGVALHYGDPLGEQRALATDVGFVDRSNRTIVVISGVDRVPWLQSITSQHLIDLAGGWGTEALILSPKGYIEHHMILNNVEDTIWLSTEPQVGPDLLGFLDTMRFVLRVDLSDVTSKWAVMSVIGPRCMRALGDIGLVAPREPYDVASLSGGGWLRRMPYPGPNTIDMMVPRILMPQVTDRLVEVGARPAGVAAFAALRVAARRPRLRFDTDPTTLPQEVGWIGVAVDPDKTGYRGQEVITRVQETGQQPRRMVLLQLSAPADAVLPPPGTPVTHDGRTVGRVGTAVHHYELGPVALALVARDVPGDAALSAGDMPASIDHADQQAVP